MTIPKTPTEVPFVDTNYSLEEILHLLMMENFNLKQQVRKYQVVLDQAHGEINNLKQQVRKHRVVLDQAYGEINNLRRNLQVEPSEGDKTR